MSTTPTTQTERPAPPTNAVDRYFKITERGSTIGTEIRGGLVTFFTMSYIIVLNPLIIGTVRSGDGLFLGGGDVPNLTAVAATTALVAGVLTILMGVVANFPLALAAGLGLNAVVAYSIAALPDMSWQDAMGIVVLEGLIILVLVLTGFRTAVFKSVPVELKTAISVGIGLFIAFIGLVDAGFVRIPASMAVPVELGIGGSLGSWPLLVFVFGLMLAIILMVRNVKGAILIAIVSATVLAFVIELVGNIGSKTDETGAVVNPAGWALDVPSWPEGGIFATPDFSLVGQFSLFGSIESIGIVAVLLLVFSLLLADFFDTMGTMVAVGSEAKLLDTDGNPIGTQKILVVDSIAAAAGGAGSVSSNTSYIESASGVGDGARTGLASVVTGIAFLLATFLAPLVSMVPFEAATPALIVVGFLMVTQITGIDWKNWELAIPAFLTIILMPFTYSITAGIGAGIITFVVIKLAVGKVREIHTFMWVASAMFLVYFLIGPIKSVLGV
ncbi:NCS2 family permease [Cellulomonas humilata]|uniref:AGZA family xanthine/uracil permease-like MFS transporter n=1 Tax=Cellulomonas humilata TaxID=144055 RepID=A0ABU0EA52_9CELL|nr:NCS2 family permease [Cellulomonas humilata]MDQ0372118.1 AGZA family xanthine/uracil permease-like MFS transporter [Cellulomonas humilata]